MTLFFAEIRAYRLPNHHYVTLGVEVPAPDLAASVQVLAAWKAGLAANEFYDSSMEESISASRRRGVKYLTLKEAAIKLGLFFSQNEWSGEE